MMLKINEYVSNNIKYNKELMESKELMLGLVPLHVYCFLSN